MRSFGPPPPMETQSRCEKPSPWGCPVSPATWRRAHRELSVSAAETPAVCARLLGERGSGHDRAHQAQTLAPCCSSFTKLYPADLPTRPPKESSMRRPEELDLPAHALRGRDLVVFSNDWDGDPLSKVHIMRIL